MINNNIKLDKELYSHLLLASLVESKPIQQLSITLNRINEETKNTDIKEVIISPGDMIEVISLSDLNLIYSFGKVARISSNYDFIYLDISDEFNSGLLYIDIENIRDIEIFDGTTHKLYLSNDN